MAAQSNQWPTADDVARMAEAAEELAETVWQNVLTDSPQSPLRLPCRQENFPPVHDAARKLGEIFKPNPTVEKLARDAGPMIVGVGPWCAGWSQDVAHALNELRQLSLSFNELLRLDDAGDLATWHTTESGTERKRQQPRERIPRPQMEIRDGRTRRTDDGIPATWVESLRNVAQRIRHGAATRPPTKSSKSYSPKELQDIPKGGISETSLRNYAKKAGVDRPARGQRNFRYPWEAARAIMRKLSQEFPNPEVQQAYKNELQKQQENHKTAR